MRKAQVSTIDFITGFVIITAALVLATTIILNLQEPSRFESVKRQALSASEHLMSEGYPHDWNDTTIVQAGILTDHQLNLTKLRRAEGLGYADLKTALNLQDDIYWYFLNSTHVLNLSSCGYGSPDVTTDERCEPSFSPDENLVRVERFVTHNDTIIIMAVIAWD
ncbi:hypothetical protein JXA12_03685 [Candidatus Woesearchaeota archaeon]|nr:hypothetical protein [Candidatus Woesearchaeota archaeon]